MKIIRNWGDLRPYGIDCLTGESCRMGTRLLCDIKEPVELLLAEFLGLDELEGLNPWNSGHSSVLLPVSILPEFAVFLLLKEGCQEVAWFPAGEIWGREETDDKENWKALIDTQLTRPRIIMHWNHSTQPGQDSRATHQMSGRVA